MKREEISVKVIAIIKKILGDDSLKIQESNRLVDDLEISSLEGFELMFLLEEQFDCNIEEKRVREFVTVEDVVNFISNMKNDSQF